MDGMSDLRLRPGCRVVRHDCDTLAVVLDDELCLVPDRDDVRRALDDWQVGSDCVASAAVEDVRDVLIARDWLVTGRGPRIDDRDPLRRSAVAADVAAWGSRAAAVVADRERRPVRLRAPGPWQDALRGLLRTAGLSLADGAGEVVLLVNQGHHDRTTSEQLVRDAIPHLWVSVHATTVEIGPFVEPGRTACLGCVDGARNERNPRHLMRMAQLGTAAALEAFDPGLLTLAAGWATRDLLAWVDGEVPATWSATVRIGRSLTVHREEWLRHPHCGCAWDELLLA